MILKLFSIHYNIVNFYRIPSWQKLKSYSISAWKFYSSICMSTLAIKVYCGFTCWAILLALYFSLQYYLIYQDSFVHPVNDMRMGELRPSMTEGPLYQPKLVLLGKEKKGTGSIWKGIMMKIIKAIIPGLLLRVGI